jgi:hypothetical protein
VRITGLYPRVRVDTSATAAVGQAGGVLLTRTVTGTGLDRFLSSALAGWRKPLAIHDPGSVPVGVGHVCSSRVGDTIVTEQRAGGSHCRKLDR